ncbi:hypothetical protein GCM10007036_17680 [Alsobacter metallidurans]|uniref:Thioredoxin domain-containing protein n=1 Tax=Alsobacter metallidurans TaxID=340221 RepID=A0A917I6J5_9HYPH|nr:TlpA disulfide reductase family protein [Alsobacter metallidurans]GGH16749.1 hypothetical protein GCM10007036_17680 [Alsobacter metallidurans]
MLGAVGAAALAIAAPSLSSAEPAAFKPFATEERDLVFPDIDGVPRALADHRGRPVVLHVFATWCEPCREELPVLAAVAAEPDAPAVVAVALAEPASRVRGFLDKLALHFETALVDDARATVKRWGVSILPTSILIDAAGAPRWKAEGPVDWRAPATAALLDDLKTKPRIQAGATRTGG